MIRSLLLDACCRRGGATKGYQEAGFEVVGIDLDDQCAELYPGDHFIKGDILTHLADIGFMRQFAAAHASPPCQSYSNLNAYNHHQYPDLVPQVRALLNTSGLPYVIENVPQAPLIDPVILCGPMFGLKLYRHRGFETNWTLTAPEHPAHVNRCARNGYLPTAERPFMSIHGGKHSKAWQRAAAEAMGVPWMTSIVDVCEAIPPAYARFIGEQLMVVIEEKEARR